LLDDRGGGLHISDIVFLVWKHHCVEDGKAIHCLRAVLFDAVMEEETSKVGARIFKELGQNNETGYDARLSVDEQHGEALVSTPLGKLVQYLLHDHQKELGMKKVTFIWMDSPTMPTPARLVFEPKDVT
jgi:hypothetical protein